MKKQFVVFLGLILTLSSAAFAQTKTVTNADLEKFRQRRLQAEREYRENYQRLGFPSPEELDRRRIEDEKNLIEFSRRLEAQRLEREAIQAEAENQALWMRNQYLPAQRSYRNYDSGAYFYGGYSPYYYDYYNRPYYRPNFSGTYRSGFSNAYPWMIIPQFRDQRPARPQPQRILPPRNINPPRPPIRTGRGRN